MTNDETLGGYYDAHHCPPAFLGADGVSYTAEIIVADEPDEGGQYGAAVLFIRWSSENRQPDGHLETGYLTYGDSRDQAILVAEGLTLSEIKEHLDQMIEDRKGRPGW